MWPETSLTRALGVALPIIQGPMAGGVTTPQLVAAVANAGGLGSLGAGYMDAATIRSAIREIRALTGRPFAVNVFVGEPPADATSGVDEINEAMHVYRRELGLDAPTQLKGVPLLEEQLLVVLEERVPILSFTFGVLSAAWLQQLHSAGCSVIGTATTVREAVALADAGVDVVVAQGAEAGGHRGTFLAPVDRSMVGLVALLPQVVDRVRIPVVAAGGIMDGRGIVAALALGAAGVQLGTAFLPCPESGAHPKYKDAVLSATDESTVLTRVFSGKPARGIANRFIAEMSRYDGAIPPYPIQHQLTTDIRRAAAAAGRAELMSLWAGQAAGMSASRPAGEVVTTLNAQVETILRRLRG